MIRDGKKADHVVGGVVAGESVAALVAIAGVARDLEWSGGMCVEHAQQPPISAGGPTAPVAAAEVRR